MTYHTCLESWEGRPPTIGAFKPTLDELLSDNVQSTVCEVVFSNWTLVQNITLVRFPPERRNILLCTTSKAHKKSGTFLYRKLYGAFACGG